MNAVTKTLIVLVFALSVAFAAVQVMLYGKRENFGEAFKQADSARRTAQEKQKAAEEKLAEVQQDIGSQLSRREADNERLAADKAEAEGQVKELQRTVADMNSTIQQREARVVALEEDMDTRDASIAELKGTIQDRDTAIKTHLDKVAALDGTIAERDATIGQLQHDLTETKKTLVATSASEKELLATITELKRRGIAVPPIALPIVNGRVVRVNSEYGVAVVDKGSNSGVKPNTTFTIYDGTEYVARLVVQDVQSDSSLGLIQLQAGRDVKEGDKATTEIP
jgi:predicted RNase H-like nuclease (RuvC/YqgF family)